MQTLITGSSATCSSATRVAAVEQREAAFGGEAVANSDSAVNQVNRVRRIYDCFAAERSLALLDSCYKGCGVRWSTTRSASARQLVKPGDSIPNRFTNPGTPCSAGPLMTKSAAGSVGPVIFGRMPL